LEPATQTFHPEENRKVEASAKKGGERNWIKASSYLWYG